jgi:formylglycine-generating enzyme required for sulfatase activity
MNIHALIVGVSKYSEGELEGPVPDSLLFAKWLRDNQVDPNNIHLFLSPTEKGERACREEAKRLGLTYRPAEKAHVDKCLDNLPSGDLLFLFWSGHGLANNADERFLLFSDFTDSARHNHLNVNNTLAFLRGKRFPKQIGFIDACAKSVSGGLGSSKRHVTGGTSKQAYLFATSPGQVAADLTSRRTSSFSQWLLEILKKGPFPPNASNVIQEMLKRFKNDTEQRPQYVVYQRFGSGPSVIRYSRSTKRYLDWLRGNSRWIELPELKAGPGEVPPPAMDSLYVRLTTASSASEHRGEDFIEHTKEKHGTRPKSVAIEKLLERHHRLLIVGGPGSGKTTFLRRIAWALCREDKEEKLRLAFRGLPLFVRVSELDEHITETLKRAEPGDPTIRAQPRWIAHFLAKGAWGLDEEFFEEALLDPKNILLLDGLDEAANSAQRTHIARMVADAPFECRCVVTSRPYEDRKRVLPRYQPIFIEGLDDHAIQGFLWQWCLWLRRGEEREAQLYASALRDAVSKPELRLFVRNPLMLTALAVVHHLQKKRLPDQRAKLFEAIMQWLGQQAEGRRKEYKQDFILRCFGNLALEMLEWKGGQTLRIGIDDAADKIAVMFTPTPHQEPRELAFEFLEDAQRNSGIVKLRGEELAFWHPSFQEYLAARALTRCTVKEQWEKSPKFLYSPQGREVLPLMAGRMAEAAPIRLEKLFGVLIRHARKSKLTRKAYAAGVLGSMFSEVKSTGFRLSEPTHALYAKLLNEIRDIFTPRAAFIPLNTRIKAADALGASGDPRLRSPSDRDYWIEIKGGAFTMGAQNTDPSNKATYDPEAKNNEPVRYVKLPTFYVGRCPVTVLEYGRYLEETGTAPPPDWEDQVLHASRPVVSVAWHEAIEYCRWASKPWDVMLPSEEQWEFAARGPEGRRYPWGSKKPKAGMAHFSDGRRGVPTPVGLFPAGNTPNGVVDMAGNVWEWTSTKYDKDFMVVRGGSFYRMQGCSARRSVGGTIPPTGSTVLAFVVSGNSLP